MPTFRASVLRWVSEAFPVLTYGYPRTYVVQTVHSNGRLDLVPPPSANHLATLPNVDPWTIAGVKIEPAVGSEVLVAFADADERKPRIIAFAPGTPTSAGVDASGTVRVGASSSACRVGGGTDTLAIGAETKRFVCYGDLVSIPVAGLAAVGPIVQNPATAPNAIARAGRP